MGGMERRQLVYIGGACLLGATGLYYTLKWIRRVVKDLRHPYKVIGNVSELYIYPVKSCRGRKVDWMDCTELCGSRGELKDRHFMVYNKSDMKEMTALRIPRMVIIDSDIRDGVLTLTTPEHSAIQVDIQKVIDANRRVIAIMYQQTKQEGFDCGDEVSEWLKKVLEYDEELGLMYYRRDLYTNRWSHRGCRWFFGLAPIKDKLALQAVAPYMAFASESIEDLKQRLDDDHKDVSARNFRPTIVISGCPAFDEDWWMELKIGDAVFECYDHCSRCVMTTVDPSTGIRDPNVQPLRLLRQYRLAPEGKPRQLYKQSPIFGVYMGLDHPGTIHVGDEVVARYKRKAF